MSGKFCCFYIFVHYKLSKSGVYHYNSRLGWDLRTSDDLINTGVGGHPALAVIMVQYDFKLTVLHYAVMFQPDAVSSAVGLLCFDSVYCKTKQEYP